MIAALVVGAALMRCPTPVQYTVVGASDNQAWAVRSAVWQIEEATGQQYVESVTPALIISFNTTDAVWRAEPTWSGYTVSQLNLIGVWGLVPAGAYTQTILMHELALARGIPEAPDPGGMFGHVTSIEQQTYSALDIAALGRTACA